jgi:hypothetical protein
VSTAILTFTRGAAATDTCKMHARNSSSCTSMAVHTSMRIVTAHSSRVRIRLAMVNVMRTAQIAAAHGLFILTDCDGSTCRSNCNHLMRALHEQVHLSFRPSRWSAVQRLQALLSSTRRGPMFSFASVCSSCVTVHVHTIARARAAQLSLQSSRSPVRECSTDRARRVRAVNVHE